MAETLIKSVRIRERWGNIRPVNDNGQPKYKWGGAGFDKKISVFKSGLTGKKRIVKAFDEGGSQIGSTEPQKWQPFASKVFKFLDPIEFNIDDNIDFYYGEYSDDAFIFQYITIQAAIYRREKFWNGTAWTATEFTNSSMSDFYLAEWISINGGTLHSPEYFGKSLNETDLKYRKKFGYLPPYFEIIQDPFIEPQDENAKSKLQLRNFGFDSYYLNNGASIQIEWINSDDTVAGGVKFSDNWQRELDPYDVDELDSSVKNLIKKRATIYGPNNEMFCLASEITNVYDGYGTEDVNKIRKDVGFLMTKDLSSVPNYEEKYWKSGIGGKNVLKNIYGGGVWDEEILNEILEKWRQVYNNTKLNLNDNPLYKGTPTLEFMLPVLANLAATGGTGATGASGSTASLITSSASGLTGATGATGASASAARVTGTYIFDVTKKSYLINDVLGELLITDKEVIEDPFIKPFEESEQDLAQLSPEYLESGYAGSEEDLIEQEFLEEEPTPERAAEDKSVLEKLESEPVSSGNWSFDPIPGEFVTNGGSKIKCVVIDGAPVNIKIAAAFLDMQAAAAKDGVNISVNSGFRSPYDSISASAPSGYKNGKKVGKSTASASSQKSLYDSYLAGKGNLAAKPGQSNHGNGIGLDLNAGGKSSGRFINVNEKVYEWLVKNSWRFGFVRTVAKEEWHYDYRPDVAAKGPYAVLSAKDKGSGDTKFYNKKSGGGYWGLDELKI